LSKQPSNIIHLIGLGSAGTNIVEAFISSKKTMKLLENENTRLSLLAIDVADPDIRSLQETYSKLLNEMKDNGIPKERISLIAQSIKFPTAEAMFDFINEKYKDHLISEGVNLKEYSPWLPSTMAIPPLAGGAGRRRALAKAIYALNYYQLGIIRNFLNSFKEQALSSIMTPVVIIIFGLGGGTGSGIAFEFARHLRKVLGSGVPIIGLSILPCRGDDPPAKGCSAYSSLTELSLLLNKDYNDHICRSFGEFYRNPFNAFICIPLTPAYSNTGNIIVARKDIDEMIIDIIYMLMDFDLSDLLGGIGTEVGLTDNFIHTISMTKVVYPVDEYIEAFKLYLERIQNLYEFRKEKLEIINSINEILLLRYDDVKEILKIYLIRMGTYSEEQFEEKIKSIIRTSSRFNEDYWLYIKGVEDQIKNWINELSKFLMTIKLATATGTIEDAIVKLTLHKEESREMDNLEDLLLNITKTYIEFPEKKGIIFERLKQLIPSSQILTVRQKRILDDFMNIAEIVDKTLQIFKFYNESRFLTETLIRYYSTIPETESISRELKEIRTELTTLYYILQLILKTPIDEAKMIDENLTYLQAILNKLRDEINNINEEILKVEESRKVKEFEKTKLEQGIGRFLGIGRRKYLKEKLGKLEIDIKRLEEERSYLEKNAIECENLVKAYNNLMKKLDVTSDYRRKLTRIIELYRLYQEKMSDILKPKKYFEKTTELTEIEQAKIIHKILAEQEEDLSREGILKEILDVDHFKDYMKSVIRVFRTPSFMGLNTSFKSDYIWVTVQTPQGLWNEDLTQEIYTVLAGYIVGEVSRNVTIRIIDSKDPWTIRILVVGGRGTPTNLEAYEEMRTLYTKSTDFEKQLSRSFLIEHGLNLKNIIEKLAIEK
jgi:hypothetical protein